MHRYKIYNINNFNKLQPNQIFNNYSELCKFLDALVLVGNSKKAQLKEWSRFIKFKLRNNNSIIIIEVYPNPLPVVDGRQLGNRKKLKSQNPKNWNSKILKFWIFCEIWNSEKLKF